MNDPDQSTGLVQLGNRVVRLSAVTSSHWEGQRLFVYLDGGRYFQVSGDDAALLWSALQRQAVDLRTGEVNKE